MTGPRITRRYAEEAAFGTCVECGVTFPFDEGICGCGHEPTVSPHAPEVVGRIDVTYETYGGQRRTVTAERHPHEDRWTPLAAVEVEPFRDFRLIEGGAP